MCYYQWDAHDDVCCRVWDDCRCPHSASARCTSQLRCIQHLIVTVCDSCLWDCRRRWLGWWMWRGSCDWWSWAAGRQRVNPTQWRWCHCSAQPACTRSPDSLMVPIVSRSNLCTFDVTCVFFHFANEVVSVTDVCRTNLLTGRRFVVQLTYTWIVLYCGILYMYMLFFLW